MTTTYFTEPCEFRRRRASLRCAFRGISAPFAYIPVCMQSGHVLIPHLLDGCGNIPNYGFRAVAQQPDWSHTQSEYSLRMYFRHIWGTLMILWWQNIKIFAFIPRINSWAFCYAFCKNSTNTIFIVEGFKIVSIRPNREAVENLVYITSN